MNGEWLAPKRGGPVRLVVPDGYGFKSIKWLQRVVLTNDPAPNDTYAGQNNDVDTTMKTFARFIKTPQQLKSGQRTALTGIAQVGMSGLRCVQYCLQPLDPSAPKDDPYLQHAAWQDAEILSPPKQWGGGLPDGPLPVDSEPIRCGGTTADLAHALYDRPLGCTADRPGRRGIRTVLSHDRREQGVARSLCPARCRSPAVTRSNGSG